MWEDGNFVKTLPVNPKTSMAEAVVVQKLKVAELGKIAKALKKVTKVGFPVRPPRRNHTGQFMHVNLTAGVVTATATVEDGKIVEQNVTTDYEALRCSEGGLLEPEVSVTYSEQDNSLSFTLSAGTEDTDPDDVVYAAIFESGTGATAERSPRRCRSTGARTTCTSTPSRCRLTARTPPPAST